MTTFNVTPNMYDGGARIAQKLIAAIKSQPKDSNEKAQLAIAGVFMFHVAATSLGITPDAIPAFLRDALDNVIRYREAVAEAAAAADSVAEAGA